MGVVILHYITSLSCLWLYFLSPTFLVTLPVNFPLYMNLPSLNAIAVGLTLRLFGVMVSSVNTLIFLGIDPEL